MSTMLNLNQDGSFSGSFSDSDVTAGEGYSYTMYCSDFTGKFTEIKKLNDHVYSMAADRSSAGTGIWNPGNYR